MNINTTNIRLITGKQNKIWEVEEIMNDDWKVSDSTKDVSEQDMNIVHWDYQGCEGTYFQYNKTCPHLEAVEKYKRINNTSFLSNNKAVEKIDFFNVNTEVFLNEDGEYVVLRSDGDYGYIEFKIYRDRDYVVFETPDYIECVGLDTFELYDTFSIDSVYERDNFDKKTLRVYLTYNTNVDDSDIDTIISNILDNDGESL